MGIASMHHKKGVVPCAIDVTGKLKPGQKNRITARVHDVGYAGGIWKPVWITASD